MNDTDFAMLAAAPPGAAASCDPGAPFQQVLPIGSPLPHDNDHDPIEPS